MKKGLFLLITIVFVANACKTIINNNRIDEPVSYSHKYYQDKIAFLNFDNIDIDNPAAVINRLKNKIDESDLNNDNGVVLQCSSISKMILSNSKIDDSFINIIKETANYSKAKNISILLEVDFNNPDKYYLEKSGLTNIKDNFNLLVTSCDINGFYFKGIDFSSSHTLNALQDIIVNCMMIKPFLIVSTNEEQFYKFSEVSEDLLKIGTIDFLVSEKAKTIAYNKYLTISEYERVLPQYVKKLSPESFITLNLEEVAEINAPIKVNDGIEKQLNTDHKIHFIISGKPDVIDLKIGDKEYRIKTNDWVIPFNYLVKKEGSTERYGSWIEFRRPFERVTGNNTYNLLCRTTYPSKVTINSEPVKIYTTGVFFNKVRLTEGLNRLRAVATDDKGNTTIYEDQIFYRKEDLVQKEKQLYIVDDSIEPIENLSLTPTDFLNVSFLGSKSQIAFVELIPGNQKYSCSRIDFSNVSQYKVSIPLKNLSHNQKHQIKLILVNEDGSLNPKSIEKFLKLDLVVKDQDEYPSLITTSSNSILTYTLAPIRLGAPIRNELPKDVILKSNGIFGDNYRIKLSETEEGYINKEFVDANVGINYTPGYYINPIASYSTEKEDIVKIPYLENVPFEVYPDPEQKRIVITLFGVKSSSTWIIHKNDLRFIEEITWQQTSKETYKIYINLKSPKIWGYDLKPKGKELVFRLKYPPIYNLESSTPLKGIKISIEAGHGGSNIGAVGLSGLKEKDINLDLSKKLADILTLNGAEIFQGRDSDIDMALLKKRDDAVGSNSNLHFSIHANSSEPVNEFLGTSGTCTFYHNPFWAKFAESVYYKLLDLELAPFGSVGSFNYRVTRMSEMPSILVEQAFMSHAEDEEKLNDDNFRKLMAEKIYSGLLNYLKYMSE
ncbi:MAG: N-acetylmuramoyl-L-alanine amidase [Melioribacteraceae bacterium]|nr:N-acetylmuramoyl-L-alanine amidase [Melioribacteraceae bacterium]